MIEDSPESLLNRTFDNISSRPIVRPAVGYIRVSTGKQSDTGMSLDAQADAIRGEAARLGYHVNEIYEEAASAYGPDSSRRPGLLQALKRASELGAPLIVASIDRLSRDLSVMDILEATRVQVISVREGKCGKKRLRALITAAAEQSDEAATRAQEAAARSKAAGRGPGNRTNLNEAARRGAVNNMVRADQKVRDLADYIESHSESEKLTWQKRADALNAAGHLNLRSETRGERIPWTAGSLRKPYKAALQEIAARKELDADPFTLKPPAGTVAAGEQDSALGASEKPVEQHVDVSGALPIPRHSTGSGTQASGMPKSGSPAVGTGPVLPSHVSGVAVPSQRRPLTDAEKCAIDRIMKARGLTTRQVMDELGVPRLNASLWSAHRNGTTVSPDMLSRLDRWLRANLSLL